MAIIRKQPVQNLKCVLGGNSANVRLTGATSTDSTGTSTNLPISADGKSFTVPLSTLGTFEVDAIIDGLPGGDSPNLIAADDNTLLALFEDPAPLAAEFELVVTA